MQRALAAAAAILGLSGCAGLEEVPAYPSFEEAPDPHTFSLRAESRSVVARVDRGEISSAELNLGRFREAEGRALRGTAFGKPVSLTLGTGEASGVIGGAPTNLTITRDAGALRVQGLVRGQISDFRLDREAVTGTLGMCSYELGWSGDAHGDVYEGRRSCRGPTEYVKLRMPATLSRWSDEERGAALAILMGGAR